MPLESIRRWICWVALLPTLSLARESFFLPRLTADRRFAVRKNVVLQFLGGKSAAHGKSCVPCSIGPMYRWVSRFCPGGMESLRDRGRTGRPRQGADQHTAWIRTVVVDQNPVKAHASSLSGPRSGCAKPWGRIRQRPEHFHGAPEPAAARPHPAAAPAVRYPVRARQHAALAKPRVA